MTEPVKVRHSRILAAAHRALGPDQQKSLGQAHYARVRQRAKELIARAEARDRLARRARLSATRALLSVRDAYEKIAASESNEILKRGWLEGRARVESELQKILGTRRR